MKAASEPIDPRTFDVTADIAPRQPVQPTHAEPHAESDRLLRWLDEIDRRSCS